MSTAKLAGLIVGLGVFCWGGSAVMGAGQEAKTLDKQISKAVECDYLLYLPKEIGRAHV